MSDSVDPQINAGEPKQPHPGLISDSRGRVWIEPVVKIGDLLTSLSLIITLISLLVAWSHERRSRDREHADRVRRAAALTLAKLERSQELTLWFYDEVQPLFVEVSELLAENQNVPKTRDYLWKQLNEVRTRTINRLHEEQIEQAYVELYGYYPDAYDILTDAISGLRSKEEVVFSEFLERTQEDVLSFAEHGSDRPVSSYQSAQLGNRLRQTAGGFQARLRQETSRMLNEPHQFILSVIEASDREILRRTKNNQPARTTVQTSGLGLEFRWAARKPA